MAIKVRATSRGFYEELREVGDEFSVKSRKELGSWMVPLESIDGPERTASGKDADIVGATDGPAVSPKPMTKPTAAKPLDKEDTI